MNPFMPRPCDIQARQPGAVEGAQIYSFGLKGDADAITDCANRYLNAAPPDVLTYRAALPYVIVTFMDAQQLTSTAGGTDSYGWVHDREMAFWVLLSAGKVDSSGKFTPERLVWWMPYVLVDTTVAMAVGREVWGFAKDIGWFTIPPTSSDPAQFVAQTRVYATINPETQGVVKPLVTVSRRDETTLEYLRTIWDDATTAAEGLKDLLLGDADVPPDVAELLKYVELLVHGEVPVTNLKQFRDATNGADACYQALVEATCSITGFHGAGPLKGVFDVTVEPYASHPIVTDLGLQVGPDGKTTTAFFAMWINEDFSVDTGTTVWQAPS